MAVAMLNKKTGEVLNLSPNDFMINLRLEPETYEPIPDSDYYVLGSDGVYVKTKGKDLIQTLGSTQGYLADKKTAEIDIAVRAEHSAAGQALQGFISEGLFLGIDKALDAPKTPQEALMEKHRQKIFGKSEALGRMAGTVLPFLAGGIGGLVRGGVKTGLKAVGKYTPSTVPFKVADKAGKVAKSVATKAGMGKRGQVFAGALGAGAGFAGFEAALSGVKTGVSTYKTPIFKGDKKIRRTAGEAMQAGGKAGAETLVTTGAWIAGLGATVKGAQLFGKGLKKGYDLTIGKGGLSPENLRKTFFKIDNTQIGKQNKAILDRHLPDVKTDKGKINWLITALEKTGIKQSSTRQGLLERVKEKVVEAGKNLRVQRSVMARTIDKGVADNKIIMKGVADTLIAYLKVTKQTGARAVTFKEFNKTIDDLIEKLKTKAKAGKLTSFDISDTLSTLYKKGKLAQRTNPELKAQKVYQRAYDQVSAAERVLARKYLKDNGKALHLAKDKFNSLKSIEEIIENSIIQVPKQGGNLASVIIGGGGYWAGGIPGALAGYAIPKIGSRVVETGFGYLQFAKAIEKVNMVTRKVRTPAGVKNLLEKGTGLDLDLSVPAIGIMLFQRNVNSLKEMNEHLNRMEEWDKTTTGFEDLFSMANDYGGKEAFNHTAIGMSRLKRAIISSLPPMKRDKRGNLNFDKRDEKMFLKDLNRWVTPINFVNALSKKQMTNAAYQKFGGLYPHFLSMFNMNFHQAVREGKVKGDSMLYYKNFLSGSQSEVANLLYSMLDYEQEGQGQGLRSAPPKRKMPKPEATISENVQGGVA